MTGADASPDRLRGRREEFATPAWFAMMGEVLVELAREGGPGQVDEVTVSELYRDVPREVAGHDAPVGWRIVLSGPRLDYTPEPDADADIVIEVDYAFARDMLQELEASDEEARAARRAAVAAARTAGLLQARGDGTRSPAILRPLHDALAARTVQA